MAPVPCRFDEHRKKHRERHKLMLPVGLWYFQFALRLTHLRCQLQIVDLRKNLGMIVMTSHQTRHIMICQWPSEPFRSSFNGWFKHVNVRDVAGSWQLFCFLHFICRIKVLIAGTIFPQVEICDSQLRSFRWHEARVYIINLFRLTVLASRICSFCGRWLSWSDFNWSSWILWCFLIKRRYIRRILLLK